VHKGEPNSAGALCCCIMVSHIPGHVEDKFPHMCGAQSQYFEEGAKVKEGRLYVQTFAKSNDFLGYLSSQH
jgi:hypothetical protein